MFMLSFRLTAKKVLAALCALILVVALGTIGVNALRGGSDDSEAVTVSEDTAAAPTQSKHSGAAKTAEDRLAFVTSFGWEIDPEPAEVQEVIIPQEFDEVYLEYNSMQKKQGYDLEKYMGKRVKRYSYVVTNHPNATGEVRINVLVYKDKVVGGDVCSLDIGGFIHGFSLDV